MMDNAQLVNIKWTNSNKKYFINKGYQYTKNGDTFYVRVEDLSVGSPATRPSASPRSAHGICAHTSWTVRP